MDEPERSSASQRKILVVDDDEATLNMLATFLTRHGYCIMTASNPLKALEILKSAVFDLVITDLMMPHIDGISFTQAIHALPNHSLVPVIMITAHGSDDLTEQGMRKGVALTLAKPLELNKLLDLVGFATH
jgi:CheY-like chemotaxis protein